jgi:hypothetical protein
MIFQLKTFQGVRYSLFHYNTEGSPGGYADFDRFTVEEPHPRGLMKPIPYNRKIRLAFHGSESWLGVQEKSLVRIAKQSSPIQNSSVSFKVVVGIGAGGFKDKGRSSIGCSKATEPLV